MSSGLKNVVIVGLGLGGVAAAQALAKALPSTHRVVGISETEFGFFPPASLRASVVPGWQDKVTLTVAGVFPRGSKHVVLGSTKVVRINKNSVTVDVAHPDFGLEIPFDALVIATGSNYPFPCRPVEGTRNIVDIVASFETQQAAVKAASSVLVVGAGATGIEWAGEVKSQYPKKTVTLISSNETLFDSPTLKPKLGKSLKNQLESLGIDIVFGSRLDTGDLKTGPIHKTIFTLNGGKTVAADYIFLATGTKPNSALVAAFDRDTVDNNGYAKVLDTLQLSGYTNIFAIGDVTNRPETKQAVSTGNHIPIVTSNVVSVLKDPKAVLKVHKIGTPLILVTVGPSGGAGQMFGFVVGSWVAKMAKSKGLMLPMFAGSYPAPK